MLKIQELEFLESIGYLKKMKLVKNMLITLK